MVCKWFRNNKMILDPEKCKALFLSRKPNVKLSLFAEGVALLLVDTVDLFRTVAHKGHKNPAIYFGKFEW